MAKKKEEVTLKAAESDKKYARLPDKVVAGLPAASILIANEKIMDLFARGKKRGKLDSAEMMLLDEFEFDNEQMEKLYDTLEALSIEISDEVIMRRMAGRRVCENCGSSYHLIAVPPKQAGICDSCGGKLVCRKDDAPETVKARLEVYHRETEPLIAFYDQRGCLKRAKHQSSVEADTEEILRCLVKG